VPVCTYTCDLSRVVPDDRAPRSQHSAYHAHYYSEVRHACVCVAECRCLDLDACGACNQYYTPYYQKAIVETDKVVTKSEHSGATVNEPY
jgi:hypothetical protein